jgi:hypothetical protein
MRERVFVIDQRPCGGFSVVKYALAAFRYLVTGIVALVLALLLVLLIEGRTEGCPKLDEHGMPASTILEDLLRAQALSERSFFGVQELRSASYIP